MACGFVGEFSWIVSQHIFLNTNYLSEKVNSRETMRSRRRREKTLAMRLAEGEDNKLL